MSDLTADIWWTRMQISEARCDYNASWPALNGGHEDDFIRTWIRLATEATCLLSIVGAVATMASYLALREMRHTVREILLHLSIMNLISSTANLVGLLLNYHKTLDPVFENGRLAYHSSYSTFHHLCLAQAFFTSYGTIGSSLWTLGLSVYLYYRIGSCDTGVTTRVMRILYVVCYALPLYVSLWLLLDGWLGYAPWSPTHRGWCTTVAVEANGDTHTLELLMTDDIWIMLSALTITVVTFTIHTHIRDQLRNCQLQYSDMIQQFMTSLRNTDHKIIVLPIVCLLLWAWHLLGNLLYVHIGMNSNNSIADVIMLLSAIGDNAQGLVNFILFCALQNKLWSVLIGRLGGCVCCSSLRQFASRDRDLDQTSRELSDSTLVSSGEWYQTSVNTPL